MTVKAPITPEVLKWARDSAGFSREEVVDRLKQKTVTVEKVQQWEQGIDIPSCPQLEKLAAMYKRPLAVFFFPEPPEEQSYNEKFRSIPPRHIKSLSPNIRYIVRQALVKQINLDELHQEGTPADIQNFTNAIKNFNLGNPIRLAAQMRDVVGISLEQQFRWSDYDEAFNHWRDRLQSLGIWVFMTAFRDDEYCGFFLPDEPAKKFPIIYINNSIDKKRQIFTLFHELGHFLIGKGGIDFRQNVEDVFRAKYQREEVFCNAFAGNFLAPLDNNLLAQMPSDKEIENYAIKYKVSREVILRRCKDKGFIDWNDYNQKVAEWSRTSGKASSDRRSGGGDYYRSQKVYLGKKYLNLAFKQYYKQHISESQLADYLGIKVRSIPGLEAHLPSGVP